MKAVRRLLTVGWPLAMLLLYGATFRRTVTFARAETAVGECVFEECLTALAEKYEASGDRGRAEDLYRRALAIDGKNGDLHVRLGELYRQNGDFLRARQHAEAALRWYPNFGPANALIARLETPRSAKALAERHVAR